MSPGARRGRGPHEWTCPLAHGRGADASNGHVHSGRSLDMDMSRQGRDCRKCDMPSAN